MVVVVVVVEEIRKPKVDDEERHWNQLWPFHQFRRALKLVFLQIHRRTAQGLDEVEDCFE
jgi:hypothetical protein